MIPDDIHGYARVEALRPTPIAGGEHEFTHLGFRELIEARALDYIQFDTNRVGGLTAARKIPRWPRRIRFRWFRMPARCTTIMS